MVEHWLDAMGDKNPIYVDEAAARAAGHPGVVAPPAMIQVWTMMGLGGVRPDDDPLGKILELFDEAGYIGVVATNCEQTYHRYLRPGEEVSVAAELTDVVGPKRTALGEGFFITQKITWQVGDEDVAEMMWRIMKFRPAEQAAAGTAVPGDLDADLDDAARVVAGYQVLLGRRQRPRIADPEACRRQPAASAGASAVEGHKGTPATDYLVASGKGTVFSFVVHHAPKVPGRTLPFVIALVELDEGVRMLGELRNVDPADRGDRNARSRNVYRLPGGGLRVRRGRCTHGSPWNAASMSAPAIQVGTKLPELSLYGDPTFIVSTAIATRDYQDVHHDRDKAQAKGSKDIFVNILTDTGLVQRYITDWAGPNAIIQSYRLRLGVPWYAYDTVTFRGEVTAVEDGVITLKVVGSNSLGDHVIATSTLTIGGNA